MEGKGFVSVLEAEMVDAGTETAFEVQEGLDAVRLRPGMYVGGIDTFGLHQLFNEIIDNAMDEAMAGYCTAINVVYTRDGSLSVQDDGRGIPIETDAETGESFVELIFTHLHWPGRFKPAGGYNGVGVACVNALSTWLECSVRRDGRRYQQRFERGVSCAPLAVTGECGMAEHGTTISWLADASIFTNALDSAGNPNYDTRHLRDRIRELAYLTPGVVFSFHDAHGGEATETFHYERGIADYISEWNATGALHPEVFAVSDKEGEIEVEVALQYNKSNQETVFCYANNRLCPHGGTHYTGFKTALTRTLNRYARKIGFLKAGDLNFSGDDLSNGLTAVVSIYLPTPTWGSTMKYRVVNSTLIGIVSRATGRALSQFLDANPETAHAILDKAEQVRKIVPCSIR